VTVLPAQTPIPVLVVLHSADLPPDLESASPPPVLTRKFATRRPLSWPGALPGADALLVWDFTIGDAVRTSWPAADALRWVHTASAGVDRLMFDAMLASDVVVTNSRGVFDTPMAEYVLGLVLAFAKDLPRTVRLQGPGRVAAPGDRDGGRLDGGGGRRRPDRRGQSPRCCARSACGCGWSGARPGPGCTTAEELPGLLGDADYLVLAAPLTDRTRGMVNAASLALLPPRARLINVGRGALVVQDDVVAALRAGTLAGAALDVFEAEPLPADSPLWTLPGVLVSPHMSGDAIGWRQSLVELFTDNLARHRDGRPLRNMVDKTHGYVTSGSL